MLYVLQGVRRTGGGCESLTGHGCEEEELVGSPALLCVCADGVHEEGRAEEGVFFCGEGERAGSCVVGYLDQIEHLKVRGTVEASIFSLFIRKKTIYPLHFYIQNQKK